MLTSNPFAELTAYIPPMAMQLYLVLMIAFVVIGTLLDMRHKKSAEYFFLNAEKAKKAARREVSSGEKKALLVKTITNEVLTSSEFSNQQRRMSHLLTMYGFIIFALSTAILIFGYGAESSAGIWPFLWHVGALMLAVGGYWFWFKIRVDVNSEGHKWNEFSRADLFILSLLATATFGLLWSFLMAVGAAVLSDIFFILFVLATTTLFGSVYWSKFAHMFFKPAAAYQKKITRADGSQENLPDVGEMNDPEIQAKFPDIPEYMGTNPPNMGFGIKREQPNHF